jgi:alpha-tubulin suppressor-like RCC1 family protein
MNERHAITGGRRHWPTAASVVVGIVLGSAVSAGAQGAAAGSSHTTVLKDDGTVWSWGANSNGQLGDGTTTQRVLPVNVTTLSNVAAIADGDTVLFTEIFAAL